MLAALGVLKLATADQMHRLMAPGHKDNKAFRNAALDLARHGLAVSEGSARDGNKLWNLTPLGLDAAAEVLDRLVGEMGGTARGAARSGAPHAVAVNETVIAITRTPATATRPVPRQQHAPTLTATEDPVVVLKADVVVWGGCGCRCSRRDLGRFRRRQCGWRGPRSRRGAWRSGCGTSWGRCSGTRSSRTCSRRGAGQPGRRAGWRWCRCCSSWRV
ncbi:replication-relaxation family protein [Streptomyces sp. NBC_01719]|uniref:replication-relaxation family protein n=1 Tax=Streptomyces sp. NBC_01719 TaxID=2975920 RepID=UPI00338FA0CB